MLEILTEIQNAIQVSFQTKAGLWITLLALPAALLVVTVAIFLLHMILQGVTGGRRVVHTIFRFIELHLLALASVVLGAWCLFTAGLALYDQPYLVWFRQSTIGGLSAALHLLGIAVWGLVGLMALLYAIALFRRAYRRSASYAWDDQLPAGFPSQSKPVS
ncbi:MAG: hypothetical protein ABIG44_05100 [Planctomycetota bacterium]